MFEISEAIKTQLGKRPRFICEYCSDNISTDIPRMSKGSSQWALWRSQREEKETSMCMWMGIKDCTTAVENDMSIPQKIKNKITMKERESVSCSVLSDSLRPHGQ